MDVLVALGTSAAYFYSVVNIIRQNHDLYFETSAILITLILVGKLLEAEQKRAYVVSIQALMGLQPRRQESFVVDRKWIFPWIPVLLADIVVVRPGEKEYPWTASF